MMTDSPTHKKTEKKPVHSIILKVITFLMTYRQHFIQGPSSCMHPWGLCRYTENFH